MSSIEVFVGIDLGTKAGFAVITPTMTYSYELNFDQGPKRKLKSNRYIQFYEHLDEFLPQVDKDPTKVKIFYEYVRRHAGTKAAHAYGAFRVALLAAAEKNFIAIEEVSVQEIKMLACNVGNAGKHEVMGAACKKWNLNRVGENEADALWIAEVGRLREAMKLLES